MLIGQINAKTVIPIHTFEPEIFEATGRPILILRAGELWTVP
jgi:hypothetical protein